MTTIPTAMTPLSKARSSLPPKRGSTVLPFGRSGFKLAADRPLLLRLRWVIGEGGVFFCPLIGKVLAEIRSAPLARILWRWGGGLGHGSPIRDFFRNGRRRGWAILTWLEFRPEACTWFMRVVKPRAASFATEAATFCMIW